MTNCWIWHQAWSFGFERFSDVSCGQAYAPQVTSEASALWAGNNKMVHLLQIPTFSEYFKVLHNKGFNVSKKGQIFNVYVLRQKKTQFIQMQRNSCYLCTKQTYIFSKSGCCSMAIRAPSGANNSITSVKFNHQLVGFNHNSIRIFWELDKLIKGSIDQFTFKAVKRC